MKLKARGKFDKYFIHSKIIYIENNKKTQNLIPISVVFFVARDQVDVLWQMRHVLRRFGGRPVLRRRRHQLAIPHGLRWRVRWQWW
jgi:hypothetical protein